MVKLIFEFDRAEITKAGLTEDELLAEVREYAKENKIAETYHGVFEKDGEDALALVGKIVIDIVAENPKQIMYIHKLTLNVNGRNEDALAATKKWLNKTMKSDVK